MAFLIPWEFEGCTNLIHLNYNGGHFVAREIDNFHHQSAGGDAGRLHCHSKPFKCDLSGKIHAVSAPTENKRLSWNRIRRCASAKAQGIDCSSRCEVIFVQRYPTSPRLRLRPLQFLLWPDSMPLYQTSGNAFLAIILPSRTTVLGLTGCLHSCYTATYLLFSRTLSPPPSSGSQALSYIDGTFILWPRSPAHS
jgi:hypothetical protein